MSDASPNGFDAGPAGPAGIVMYESAWCGYCRAARRLLDAKGWDYEARGVDGNAALRAEARERSGRTSVPQIWFGAEHVGGFDDLAALEDDGELDALYAREVADASDGAGPAPG